MTSRLIIGPMQPLLFLPLSKPYTCSPLLGPVPFESEEKTEILGFLLDKGWYVMPAPPRFEGDLLPGWLLGTHCGDAHVREEQVHFGHVAAQAHALGYGRYRRTALCRERIKAQAKYVRPSFWEGLLA